MNGAKHRLVLLEPKKTQRPINYFLDENCSKPLKNNYITKQNCFLSY